MLSNIAEIERLLKARYGIDLAGAYDLSFWLSSLDEGLEPAEVVEIYAEKHGLERLPKAENCVSPTRQESALYDVLKWAEMVCRQARLKGVTPENAPALTYRIKRLERALKACYTGKEEADAD